MKKILTIDGGGIKGVFAASFLAQIEEECDVRICDYFDLIAGTSTGGIIAAALAVGIPVKDILEMYMTNGKKIFPKNRRWMLSKGKYDSKPLQEALGMVFEQKCIKDCKTRLLMPAFNLESGKVRVFKTPHADDLWHDKDLKIVDCVLATTAAPLYFQPHGMKGGTYVDGGIGANNPSLIALVEAITRCGWKTSEISMLSIAGVTELGPTTGFEKMGLIDALKIQKCFMCAEAQYADNICKIMLPTENYQRIVWEVDKKQFSLDGATDACMSRLKSFGESQAMQDLKNIQNVFLRETKEEVQFNLKVNK